MSHSDPTAAKTTAADRAKRWSTWLVATMKERGLRNSDLVRLLRRPGYDSGTVANWRKGRHAPSELGAMVVADALHLPAPDVLRAAGYEEMAARIEHLAARGITPPPRDPVLEQLDAIGDPALTAPLAAEYQRDLAAAQRRLELELAELRRQLAPSEARPDAGQDTA